MKNFVKALGAFCLAFICIPLAKAATVDIASGTDLQTAINNATAGDVLVLADGTYTGNITVNKNITLKGSSATGTVIDGQITIESDFNLDRMTVTAGYVDSTYRNVLKVTGSNHKVQVTNANLNIKNFVAGENYGSRVAGIRIDKGADNTNLTVSNTNINSTYGLFVKSAENNITIKDSNISGWAALELSSNDGDVNANNIVKVSNSILTGVGYQDPNPANDNDYSVISLGSQEDLVMEFTGTTIQNKIITANRQDLVYFNDYYGPSATSELSFDNCKLINNDSTGDSSIVNFATENNTLGGNVIAISANTTITSANSKKIEVVGDNIMLTLSTIEGDAMVAIPKGTVITEEMLAVVGDIEGYTFGGWYTDKDYKTKFVAGTALNADTTLYAKFTEKTQTGTTDSKLDDVPKTSNTLPIALIGLVILTAGTGVYTFKLAKSRK